MSVNAAFRGCSAKYVNHALLAQTLSRYASTIINSEYAWPLPLQNETSRSPLGDRILYSYTCGKAGVNGSVIFLFNRHVSETGVVTVSGKRFVIPYWTLLIVDGLTLEVAFDSNTLTHPAYPMPWLDEGVQRRLFELRSLPSGVLWQAEPVGVQVVDAVTSEPVDQLMWSGYSTSYLLYSINVSITADVIKRGTGQLTVERANDFLYVWIDSTFQLSHPLIQSTTTLTLNTSTLTAGVHQLTLATVMMGTDNYTPDSGKHKGLAGGNITWEGDHLTDGQHTWHQQKGLTGERLHAPDRRGPWVPLPATRPAWSWYWLNLTTPVLDEDPTLLAVAPPPTYQLNLTTMGKGVMWINSHEVSLYWLAVVPDQCQSTCNRTGTLGSDDPGTLCRTGCGEFYQRGLYHVPADWLQPAGGGE